jgi:3-polyprenyl-4-hydroxybenzoate decarboxylase
MKKILIGITGGIAAYKAIDVISALQTKGYEVHAIMTESAKNFCPSAVVDVISHSNLKTETPNQTLHIEEAKWCDVMIILPATANTIAKIVNGIADNFLTTTWLALPKEKIKIICPAMNTNMWENPITKNNLYSLKKQPFAIPLVEVINPVVGLLACGDYGMGKLPSTKNLVEAIVDIIDPLPNWLFPLPSNYRGTTIDSYSFLDYDWKDEVEIPLHPHVGSFGIRRRHDCHKGVDLYAEVGTAVYAVEFGIVVDICPFTGHSAGFPFWEDTVGVYIEGNSGIVVYGELGELKEGLKIGDFVPKSNYIGQVARIIKNDKGRPMSMLHLELHKKGHVHTGQWELGKEKPEGVLDPTPYLIKSYKEF